MFWKKGANCFHWFHNGATEAHGWTADVLTKSISKLRQKTNVLVGPRDL